jgi:hypothetical protein
VRPPREKEGRGDRGRVLQAASQTLRQEEFPSTGGISAMRPAKAWLLLCFRRDKITVGKRHQTVTGSFPAKQLARATLLRTL